MRVRWFLASLICTAAPLPALVATGTVIFSGTIAASRWKSASTTRISAPVQARVAPSDFMLGGQASRPVLVVVPFDGAARKVRIFTEASPFLASKRR
jgi:hypothetical protein